MDTSSLLSCNLILNLFFFLLLIEMNFLVSVQEVAGEHHVIDVKSLLPSNSCSMPEKSTTPSRFNVVLRHSMCSSQAHKDKLSYMELLRRDQARFNYIQRQFTNANAHLNSFGGSLFARVPVSIDFRGSATYIVNIGLGTPTKSFSVMIDTGSDLTWTQCIPCVNCYPQTNPIFDPTLSSTFKDILCNSEYCTKLKKFGCSSKSTCLYEQQYVDKSSTNGSLIQDTLTISSDTIENFRFGCGHNNIGDFAPEDGLLGLGRGNISIISQTAQRYSKVFSYCLPSRSNEIGYLELGISVPSVKYTPMQTNQKFSSFYLLNLTAISIQGIRIPFSPIEMLLDSGATISYLPPTIYSAFRSIFQKQMIKYPIAPPLSNLDTCYDLTGHTDVTVPEIVLIFDGEVMASLDASGILYVTSVSQMCLSFTKTKNEASLAVFGNMHQRRFNIVYDVGNSRIGFGSNGCN